MPVLAGERIFTVAGTPYAWEDLVLAGCLWGDRAALEARGRDGLACLAGGRLMPCATEPMRMRRETLADRWPASR